VKLDENLPAVLVGDLAAFGHDADSVPQEGIQGRPDGEVFAAAQSAGRFLVTQDLDFSDVRKFAPGTHHGLLPVRLRTPGRTALRQRIRALFENEDVASWKRGFVVATDRKVRLRRPPR
jgi:hypothetical protein